MSEHAPSPRTELTQPKGGALPAGHAMVFEREGAVFANSRDVADYFGKRHDHVLRDIRHLVAEGFPKFGEGSYTLPETGPQNHPCFDMDRDGFSLLAMGFTGKRALKWKLLYIEAFNKMEAELRARAVPVAIDFTDNAQIIRLAASLTQVLLTEREKTVVLTEQNAALAPKAAALAQLAETDGTFNFRDTAKQCGHGQDELIARLSRKGWIFKQDPEGPWLAYAARIKSGHLVCKTTMVETPGGKRRARIQTRVTTKGLALIAKRFAAEAAQ